MQTRKLRISLVGLARRFDWLKFKRSSILGRLVPSLARARPTSLAREINQERKKQERRKEGEKEKKRNESNILGELRDETGRADEVSGGREKGVTC